MNPEIQADDRILSADFELGFTYTRSPGAVIGRCLAALQQKTVLGMRADDGSVLFPPTEYDPRNGDELKEWVILDGRGILKAWTWPTTDAEGRALALIQLQGSDTPFLHWLVAAKKALKTGIGLRIVWAEERVGAITDIAHFEVDPQEPSS